MADMKRTLADLAREVLEVQNASNLSGVVHAFSRAVTALRECLPGPVDTNTINRHPIAVMWIDKLADLARCCDRGTSQDYSRAYGEVTRLAENKE